MDLYTNFELLAQIKTLPYIFPFQILLFCAVLVALFVGKFSKFGKAKDRELPPGPAGWPIVGNLPQMVMNRPTFRWIHSVMKEMKTDIACFRFASVRVIAITSDEIAREAFRDKDAIFADRVESSSADFISIGYKALSFSHFGEHWKKMRRVMTTEVMSTTRLNWLLDQRTIEADNLVAYVHNLYRRSNLVNVTDRPGAIDKKGPMIECQNRFRSKATVNMRDIVRTYCQAVTMRMMFGRRYFKDPTTDDGELGQMEKEQVDAIFKTMDYIFSFCISDYVPFLRGWDLDGHEKTVREAGEIVGDYNNMIIEERLELWRDNGGKKAVEDWLDIFITLKDVDGKPLLTPEEIKAQFREISLAAIDNPTNNVEWTFAELLNHPEILRKAVDEVDRVVGKDRLVQESDIPNLNYIKSCSRESFRLHPVAPFVVPHVAIEDATLGGYFIPKGSHILVSRPGLGQNPRIWNEPHVFKPERHFEGNECSSEVALLEPGMRFVSFSTGRRGCVAGRLGTNMTVMLLARLLQGFNWSLPPGMDRVELAQAEFSMLLAKPLLASVEPRLAPNLYPKFRN